MLVLWLLLLKWRNRLGAFNVISPGNWDGLREEFWFVWSLDLTYFGKSKCHGHGHGGPIYMRLFLQD